MLEKLLGAWWSSLEVLGGGSKSLVSVDVAEAFSASDPAGVSGVMVNGARLTASPGSGTIMAMLHGAHVAARLPRSDQERADC